MFIRHTEKRDQILIMLDANDRYAVSERELKDHGWVWYIVDTHNVDRSTDTGYREIGVSPRPARALDMVRALNDGDEKRWLGSRVDRIKSVQREVHRWICQERLAIACFRMDFQRGTVGVGHELFPPYATIHVESVDQVKDEIVRIVTDPNYQSWKKLRDAWVARDVIERRFRPF